MGYDTLTNRIHTEDPIKVRKMAASMPRTKPRSPSARKIVDTEMSSCSNAERRREGLVSKPEIENEFVSHVAVDNLLASEL
jgi:hypothetical protein